MDKIRENGKLTSEEITDLMKEFPDTFISEEDFNAEFISGKALENLANWIKLLYEQADLKGLTKESMEALETYVGNLSSAYMQLGVTAKDAQKLMLSSIVESVAPGEELNGAYRDRYVMYQDTVNALHTEFGENINWSVVAQLALDPSSATWTIEEWINNYNNKELEMRLKLDVDELQKIDNRIELRNSKKGVYEAEISRQKAEEGTADQTYYDRILALDIQDISDAKKRAFSIGKKIFSLS